MCAVCTRRPQFTQNESLFSLHFFGVKRTNSAGPLIYYLRPSNCDRQTVQTAIPFGGIFLVCVWRLIRRVWLSAPSKHTQFKIASIRRERPVARASAEYVNNCAIDSFAMGMGWIMEMEMNGRKMDIYRFRLCVRNDFLIVFSFQRPRLGDPHSNSQKNNKTKTRQRTEAPIDFGNR